MITYRLATTEDNEQLIRLTAAAGMNGETILRIDRRPDFFKLLEKRGESLVHIALDGNTIVGSLCASRQFVYVGGEIFPVYYIGDFKVMPSHRNMGIGLELCNRLSENLISRGADLAFLNVSRGNERPFIFFKNRSGIPDFDSVGTFHVHQFIGRKQKPDLEDLKEETRISGELVSFLNSYYARYELGPVIREENLAGLQIFTVRRNHQIQAVMCLSDTMHLKQNVIMKLSLSLQWQLRLLNGFHRILGISRMPALHKPVNLLYIKYLAADPCDKNLVKGLVRSAMNIAYQKSYSFASIGLHENDPLQDCFGGLFKMTFHSVGLLVSMQDNRQLVDKIKTGVPFEDYSLV